MELIKFSAVINFAPVCSVFILSYIIHMKKNDISITWCSKCLQLEQGTKANEPCIELYVLPFFPSGHTWPLKCK